MKKLLLAALMLLLVPSTVYGQTSTIEGRVLEPGTARPIEAVSVVAMGVGPAPGEARYGATTDADGRFRIMLPPGPYIVRATAIGYVPAQERVELDFGETASLTFRLELNPYELSEIVVSERRPVEATAATVRRLDAEMIERQDPATVADVAQLIPAAHVHTNSRGQTILYFRDSNDRQTAQFFEGALLNGPWDNRVDLSMLPAAMLEGVTATTGVPSVLYGANVIAGAANFRPRTLAEPGQRTKVTGALGTQETQRASVVHLRREGDFSFTAAADYASQGDEPLADDAFPMAEGVFSQPSDETRVNTDRWIASGFLRGAYQFDEGSRLSVSAFHVDSEKGIAPESNVDPTLTGVRYWRYPTWRKSMLIVNGEAPFGDVARVRGAAWFNRFEQDIHQFTSVAYDELDQAQNDLDYTGGLRLIGELPTGSGTLFLSGNALTTRHRQNVVFFTDGAPAPDSVSIYRQHILSAGVEYDLPLTDRLRASAGAAVNTSIMAETGRFPERDPFSSWDFTAGLTYDLSDGLSLKAAAGHKTRFPTMRELFDAALDKFVVNPDLGAVEANMVELGVERLGAWLSGSATAFFQETDGTIDQRTIQTGPDAGKEQRINLGGSRTYGLDLTAATTPTERLRVDGQLTWMHTRDLVDGETVKRNEKPAWLAQLTALYDLPLGLEAMGQLEYTGGAYARTEQNTFVDLPSAAIIDARLSYAADLAGRDGTPDEVFVRVDNVTDDVLILQLGLPGPGRSFLTGVKLTL